jgi:hypothetical protein
MTRRGNPNWVKGVSGNPGGRPKLAEDLKKRALDAVDKIVLDYWIEEVATRGLNATKCSELLAAYGMGKPVQPVEGKHEVTVNDVREMSRERLLAIAAGQEGEHVEH